MPDQWSPIPRLAPSPGSPPVPIPARTSRKRLIPVGALLAGLGVLGGVTCAGLMVKRMGDAAEALARAPIGCTTTLDVSDPGTFNVYLETRSQLAEVPGGCPARTGIIQHGPQPVLAPQIRLVDPSGGSVVVRSASKLSYDVGRYRGELLGVARLDVPGEYQLVVDGNDPTLVVAVGARSRDPLRAGAALLIAMLALFAVAVVGVVVFVVGLRNRSKRLAQSPWPLPPPGSGWGHGPPGGAAR